MSCVSGRSALIEQEISQGSVAMQLRCVVMFNNDFIARLLLSLPVKGFLKIGLHLLRLRTKV